MSASGRGSTLNLPACPEIGNRAVGAIHAAYERYHAGFEEITRRARERFERRDWVGAQADATARLALYRTHVDGAVADVHDILQDAVMERTLWAAMRACHAHGIAGRPDAELAQTFFNSVTRRVFSTVGRGRGHRVPRPVAGSGRGGRRGAVRPRRVADAVDAGLVRRVLERIPWSVPYASLERDATIVARLMNEALDGLPARGPDRAGRPSRGVLPQQGRVRGRPAPARRHHRCRWCCRCSMPSRGIVVDAVLMTQNEVSIVFGFSWSYFRVGAPQPRALVEFLSSIMPLKRVNELYNGIGYNKHGKTELFRSLMAYLADPGRALRLRRGRRGDGDGGVHPPRHNLMFKIIRDRFGAPKNTTRQAVMDKYHFVFVRDRVGRLADAQEFEHLEFPRRCFPDDLLAYLLAAAAQTVRVEGDRVVVRHVYTERRVTPLNLFLRDAEPEAARETVLDYGNAIKDLAAADIFTGDMLLKNFGVTRNGRVICYDYDELCLLSECRFRRIPPPTTIEEEFAAEPWFFVGEQDVFPEEFSAFLVPPGELRDSFLAAHGDLLGVEFWQGVQRRLAAGEVVDVFPYRRSALLRRE